MKLRSKKRRFNGGREEIELSMTPMIDVVFQLLIYFLVTFSTSDLLAFLDVSRPATDSAQLDTNRSADMIRVAVMPEGFAINGRNVSSEELGAMLARLASVSTEQTVLVVCDDDAFHGRLIQALDMCASCGLNRISVMSGQ